MKFWYYIGEFFLLRWLFGKLQYKEDYNAPVGKYNDYYHIHSSNSYGSNKYDRSNQSYNNFHEEQDDYDMMDDF